MIRESISTENDLESHINLLYLEKSIIKYK